MGPGVGGKQKAPCPRQQSEWQWAGRVPGVTRGTVLPAGRGGPAPSRTLLGGSGCSESRKRATKEGDRVLQPDPCPCPGQRLMDTWGGPGDLVGREGGSLSSAGTKPPCKSHTVSLSFSTGQKRHPLLNKCKVPRPPEALNKADCSQCHDHTVHVAFRKPAQQ